jgi:hypothetical protein
MQWMCCARISPAATAGDRQNHGAACLLVAHARGVDLYQGFSAFEKWAKTYLCTAGIGYGGPAGLASPNGIAAF